MSVGPTGDTWRVLQVHPTRRCNLRCLHCYSASSPEEQEELDVVLLSAAVRDASAEGYTVAGVSGGEPLLYRPLRQLLDHAHRCGMVTTVTSNGMLLDARRLELLRGAVDLFAISLDGVPTSHNRMRAATTAFETMVARLPGLRQSGIPFGFIFTLTQYNLHELEWVANFALAQGARLLQVHPLEAVGRAQQGLPGARPDALESAYAYVEVARIQAMTGDQLRVQLDLVNRNVLRCHPERVFADEAISDTVAHPLAELVSPLVIESDGTVVPIRHGFLRDFALGNLHEAPLRDLAAGWRRERYDSFRALCRRVFAEVTVPAELPFVNWYEVIARGGGALLTT